MNRKLTCLTLTLAVVLGLNLTSTANADITEGLVGYWTFDEGGGTIAYDSSGNGNDGTLNGDPQWVTGMINGALEFDGDGDYVEVPDHETLHQWERFTVAAWIYQFESQSSGMRIIDKCTAGTSNGPHMDTYPGRVIRSCSGSSCDSTTSEHTLNEWHYVAVTYDEGDKRLYVDGSLEVTATTSSPLAGNSITLTIGCDSNKANRFIGIIDEAAYFGRALTEDEILIAMEGIGGDPKPQAFGPNPKDGTMLDVTWASISWKAGGFAVSHSLYFGTSFDDVNEGAEGTFVGNLATASQIVGFPSFPAPEGLQPGTTYYWRVDEVNDADPNSPWKGDVWSFWIQPRTAYKGSPADGAANVLQDATLSWTPGMGASLHQVYFGDNLDDVSNASGAVLQSDATHTPSGLEVEKTYYWRVDEFDSTGTTHTGDVWSFATVPDIAVTNPNLTLWWTLDEGEGATAVDRSGHGNHGALVGDAQWTDGYQGTALTFGGDVYVEAAGYDGVTGAAPRTCCAWVNTTTTGNHNIMSWGQNVAGQKWRMRVEGAVGVLRVEVNGGYHYGVTPIADGRWHHVAITFEDDGTPDVLDTLLYVDGQIEATGASLDEPIDTAAGPVRIGESPWHNAPFTDQIDDARVYDKVLTAEEIQQVMLGNTKLAGSPVPYSGAIVDIRDIGSLSWSAGDTAASHDVYFGTDRDAVAGADNGAPEFKGNQAGTSLSLADLVEFGGGDYYWRIDEVAADGVVAAGTIWKFTVPDYLVVEDFESYNDLAEDDPASNRIYLTWIDGFGTTTNGAVAGNLDVPLMVPGRESAQAMPVSYDNAGKTSEATKTLTSGKDWTEQGVTKLVVWFSGDSANAAERMYVALGNAVVYHPDDAATQDTGWNEWAIDLQEFADQGANLANVGSITLGFGTRNAPVATGGIGTVEFDDIGLIQ